MAVPGIRKVSGKPTVSAAPKAGRREAVRARLHAAYTEGLPVPRDTEPYLAAALGGTLAQPGTLVRAELAFLTGRAFGLGDEAATRLATALEYFHTASLVIDDLPAMDDAAMRRGAPAVHRVYGEGTAMLASLALVNRAYALVWQATAGSPRQGRALGYLERYLGLGGLLDGQSRDIHGGGANPQRVAIGKTVALLRLSLVLPALLGRADEHALRLLDRLSLAWGLAYQIIDDLGDVLDTHGSKKTAGRDAALNRPNLALALGLAGAFARLQRLLLLGDRLVARLGRREPRLFFLEAVRERFARETRELAGSFE